MTNDDSKTKKRKRAACSPVTVQHAHVLFPMHRNFYSEQIPNIQYRAADGWYAREEKRKFINHLKNSAAIAIVITNLYPSIIYSFFAIPNNTSLLWMRKKNLEKELNRRTCFFLVLLLMSILVFTSYLDFCLKEAKIHRARTESSIILNSIN